MKTTQKRAVAGGEFGANGEWYEGGKFINTVADNAKRQVKQGTRKEQIAPYAWEIVPVGMRSIFDYCFGEFALIVDGRLVVRTCEYSDNAFRYFCQSREKIAALCERWNQGERWISSEELAAVGK